MTHTPHDQPLSPKPGGEAVAPDVPVAPDAPDTAVHTPVKRPTTIAHTRTSGIWVAVVIALVVLVFLLVFILQNLDPATVHFLGFSGSLPLALAMLFGAIAGGLLVALAGAARILQLRHQTKRARKTIG